MDLNGARLDYLRNDYIYFRRVLTWLRSPESQKFEGGDYHRFSTKTQQVIDSIIKLDATLTGLEPGRIYRVEIGRRALKDGDRFVEWGPWESLVEKNSVSILKWRKIW
jgi:hypothetical protein